MIQNTGTHRMNRRSCHNDYRTPGIYHITIRTNGNLRLPLGTVVGSCEAAPGSADEPRVALNSIGAMVEQELTTSISAHYPMIEIEDYVVMPDHLHFIVNVRFSIVSAHGRCTHLGQVIAGFKKGCNRRYWEMTGQGLIEKGLMGKPSATEAAAGSAAASCLSVSPKGYKVPSGSSSGRPPLFEGGYVDVMPLREGQLEQQRRYIRNNPRSRLLRSQNRQWLQAKRRSITTALSMRALHKYLLSQCGPRAISDTEWQKITSRLMTTDGMVTCDSYGDLSLLSRRLLPVVCHRKDASRFSQQLQTCLDASNDGAVLVSAHIAKGEQAIIDEAIGRRCPVILMTDNGFPEIYHPSETRIQQCAEGLLLMVTPWIYHYRSAEEGISVAECKTMNCIVQSLCRLSDEWWK